MEAVGRVLVPLASNLPSLQVRRRLEKPEGGRQLLRHHGELGKLTVRCYLATQVGARDRSTGNVLRISWKSSQMRFCYLFITVYFVWGSETLVLSYVCSGQICTYQSQLCFRESWNNVDLPKTVEVSIGTGWIEEF